MKILIYSEDQTTEGWLKETFQKQELVFTKTASDIGDHLDSDLIILDYQTKLEDTAWDICESGFQGELVLLADNNLPKTQKVASSLDWHRGGVQSVRSDSLKGYSAKKVCKLLGVDYSETMVKEAQIDKRLKKNIAKQQKEFQSIFDILLDRLPGLLPSDITGAGSIDDKSADRLYEIWKQSDNKIKGDTFRKPIEVKSEDIATLERSGLVKMDNDKVTITAKGKEVLNVMILGDERSIFEHDGTNPLYREAKANTDVGKRIKRGSMKK